MEKTCKPIAQVNKTGMNSRKDKAMALAKPDGRQDKRQNYFASHQSKLTRDPNKPMSAKGGLRWGNGPGAVSGCEAYERCELEFFAFQGPQRIQGALV